MFLFLMVLAPVVATVVMIDEAVESDLRDARRKQRRAEERLKEATRAGAEALRSVHATYAQGLDERMKAHETTR
jgi:hypothetical protein